MIELWIPEIRAMERRDLPTTLRQYIQPEMLGRAATPFEKAVLDAADEIDRLRALLPPPPEVSDG